MIHKTREDTSARNRRVRAGNKAEQDMAFYLRRDFGEGEDIHVFNDLRLIRGDKVAQIDHLVIHKHGMVIIESKRISGSVEINPQLEFTRVHGRKRVGMESPIEQARRQGNVLRELLNDHKQRLRDRKLLGAIQGGFLTCPIEIFVAISANGQIIRKGRVDVEEVRKADQIPALIHAHIERHRKAGRLLGKPDGEFGGYVLTESEATRVCEFLLEQHTPLKSASDASASSPPPQPARPSPPPAPSSAPTQTPTYLCTHCLGVTLDIRYGKSYYFKCLDCGGNTPIRNDCPTCQGRMTTRKRGAEYSAVCDKCDASHVFFTAQTAVD